MSNSSAIEEAAAKTEFTQFGYVRVESLKFYDEVREICKTNKCGKYGTSWACPPATGTVEECKERVSKYSKMLLFSKVYLLEDSFDFEGMMAGAVDFKELTGRFRSNIPGTVSNYLLLSNEGCKQCKSCTYPNAPCRFPELLHHSLEGYGFVVSELAREAGIKYNNGPDTVTYFGAILFNEECKLKY